MQDYLTRKEVAARYPLSESLLARLASQGRGPVFFKPIDKALYRPQDVEAWIEASPGIQAGAPASGGRGRKSRCLEPAQPTVRTNRQLKNLTPSAHSALSAPIAKTSEC